MHIQITLRTKGKGKANKKEEEEEMANLHNGTIIIVLRKCGFLLFTIYHSHFSKGM